MKDAKDLAHERVYNALVTTLTKIFEQRYNSTKGPEEYDTQEYEQIEQQVQKLAGQLPDWDDYTFPNTAKGIQDFEEELEKEAREIIAKV